MADLSCKIAGIDSLNPFWLASAPPTDKAYNVERAFREGWGGVVPELASRNHIRKVIPTILSAVEAADLSLEKLGGVAVTQGPGLAGCLLVGISVAKGIALGSGLPLIGVHHIEGETHGRYETGKQQSQLHHSTTIQFAGSFEPMDGNRSGGDRNPSAAVDV